MIEPFKGELFIHPAALDYSGNTCSNNCAYCFASMRSAARRASLVKLSKLCLGKCGNNTLTDWLFNQGFPVCVSNRSDPFARSNVDNTKVALELLDLADNGVFFQTKGISDGVDTSILDGFKKKNVVMYITISSLDEGVSRRVEPGAPLPRARIELAKYAKYRGWEVIIGLNPCVKAWMPEKDVMRLEDELLESGIDRYLVMPLSLNDADVVKMNANRRAMMEDSVVSDATNFNGDHFFWQTQYRRMNKRGLHAYSVQGYLPCHMDDLACEKLGKHMNSVQHFNDFAWDEYARTGRRVFTFDDFLSVMTKGNPELLSYVNGDCYKYIMCVNRQVWKSSNRAKSARSFADVYRVLWNDARMGHSPQRRFVFTKLLNPDGTPDCDDFGNIKIAFLGGGVMRQCDRSAAMTADEIRGKGVSLCSR